MRRARNKNMTSFQMVRIAMCGAGILFTASAQQHELGLTMGGILSQQRGALPAKLDLGSGLALQANYGYRVLQGRSAALYVETHFLANGLRAIRSANLSATRDVATIFVAPGLRIKFLPGRAFSPYVAAGGGYALYEQSLTTLAGRPNSAPRFTNRGVFDFGGGVDTRLWRFIGLRAEIRDFYSGNPSFNAVLPTSGQHNVVASGGFVLRFGQHQR